MAEKIARKANAETQPAQNKKEDFILKYKNLIIGGVIAIIAIIVGIVFWNTHKTSKLNDAQTASAVAQTSLYDAQEALMNGMNDFSEQ